MALIACPECKHEVSDKASSCPHCGNPLIESADRKHRAALSAEPAPDRAVMRAGTATKWKVIQIAGFAISVVGVAKYVGGNHVDGMSIIILGLVILGGGRFMGWWKHG